MLKLVMYSYNYVYKQLRRGPKSRPLSKQNQRCIYCLVFPSPDESSSCAGRSAGRWMGWSATTAKASSIIRRISLRLSLRGGALSGEYIIEFILGLPLLPPWENWIIPLAARDVGMEKLRKSFMMVAANTLWKTKKCAYTSNMEAKTLGTVSCFEREEIIFLQLDDNSFGNNCEHFCVQTCFCLGFGKGGSKFGLWNT